MTMFKLTATNLEPGLYDLAVSFTGEDGAEVLAGETSVLALNEEQALEYGRNTFVPDIQRNTRQLRSETLTDVDAPVVEPATEGGMADAGIPEETTL